MFQQVLYSMMKIYKSKTDTNNSNLKNGKMVFLGPHPIQSYDTCQMYCHMCHIWKIRKN